MEADVPALRFSTALGAPLPGRPPFFSASPTSRPPSLLQLSPLISPTIVERWRGGEVGGGGEIKEKRGH